MKTHYNVFSTFCVIFGTLLVVNGLYGNMHGPQRVKKDHECLTVGGNDVGVPCKFPFVYDMWDDFPYVPATMIRWFSTERRFENCTDYRKKSGRSWCATKVTPNDRYVPGHWGECPDTYICNTVEGSYQPWSSWSEWTQCSGGRCGNTGKKRKTRTRNIFSRKAGVRNDLNIRSNEEKDETEKACMMRECPGWTHQTCTGGVDIFRENESYLISLIGDTKENCKALCDALPECSLAKFHSGRSRSIYKCIPKSNFEGQCRDGWLIRENFYVKKKIGPEEATKHEASNLTTIWKWDAWENGQINDCRFCVQTRSELVWNSCRGYCTDIPETLKDMKAIVNLSQQTGLWIWNRERLLKMFKNNKTLFRLFLSDSPNFEHDFKHELSKSKEFN